MATYLNHEMGSPFLENAAAPHYTNEDLKQLAADWVSDETCPLFVAVFFGVRADLAGDFKWTSYQEYRLLCFSIHDAVAEIFAQQQLGFEIDRDGNSIHLMGVFPREHAHDFVSFYLEPILAKLQERFGIALCLGVGLPTDDNHQLKNSYHTARYAFEFFFFDPCQIIEFQNIHKEFSAMPEDYYDCMEDAFRSILSRDPQAVDKILAVVDFLGDLHYGNWRAVVMRIMDFTGVLISRLYRYHLLDGDFFRMQDELQELVFRSSTLAALKECVREHFEELLPRVFAADRLCSSDTIEKVKLYMEENYMEDLSLQKLADIACVSPNYFSHLFKKETGKNYKSYLIGIRMQKAQDLLLKTNLMIYEISELVGYNNTRTFVDAFRQAYAVSPSEFRKNTIS